MTPPPLSKAKRPRKRWRSEADAAEFGFRWESVDVIRETMHTTSKGVYRALIVETDKQCVRLWITPKGMIRVSKPFPQVRP